MCKEQVRERMMRAKGAGIQGAEEERRVKRGRRGCIELWVEEE